MLIFGQNIAWLGDGGSAQGEVIMIEMVNTLTIASYNCRRLPKNNNELHLQPDILSLFGNFDLICFQETWLAKQNLDVWSAIVCITTT